MRSLLAIALIACAAPRPFAPERVYVVAPCVREKHEEMSSVAGTASTLPMYGNGTTLRDSSVQDGGTLWTLRACEPSVEMPTVNCVNGAMQFDGCRWACRPFFDVPEMPPAPITFDVNGYDVEGQE